MTKTINSDLIRGNINTIILKSLYSGDRYGYDIIREIEEKSHGQYILKQPTLYSCLKRLESQGFITSYWGEQSNGGRRKYYTLTDMGREVFIQSQDEYEFSRTIIDQLISERDYDLDSVEKPEKDDDEYKEVDAEKDVEIDTQNIETTNNEIVEEVIEVSPPADEDITTEENTNATIQQDYSEEYSIVSPQNATEEEIDFESYLNEGSSYTSVTATKEPEKRVDPTTFSYFANFIDTDSNEQNENITENASEEEGYLDTNEETYEPAISESASTVILPPQPQKERSVTDDFLSYRSPAPTYNYEPVQTQQPAYTSQQSNDTEYKSSLSHLIDGFNTPFTEESATSTEINKDTLLAQGSLSVKEKIQVKNFGKLTESMREMGDTVKIRTPNSNAAKEYNQQFYYYRNKLRLWQSGALFLLMIVETLLTYVIIKTGFGIHTPNDLGFYICAVLFCLAFPISAGILFLSNPFKRKRVEFNLRTSFIFRFIIMLQVILIVYALCVYMGMPIAGSTEYTLFFILPAVLSTNIPVSAIIFNSLYKSKRFAVEN